MGVKETRVGTESSEMGGADWIGMEARLLRRTADTTARPARLAGGLEISMTHPSHASGSPFIYLSMASPSILLLRRGRFQGARARGCYTLRTLRRGSTGALYLPG